MILVELQELKENTMAEFEKQDFSFLSEDIEDEKVEIEVVDDTPEEDRINATPMPKEIVDEFEAEEGSGLF